MLTPEQREEFRVATLGLFEAFKPMRKFNEDKAFQRALAEEDENLVVAFWQAMESGARFINGAARYYKKHNAEAEEGSNE